jgi:ribosomal protein S18 acetylase RimI-like enzyme
VPAPWADVDAPAAYLNRLAVAPALQGHGIGAACLDAVATRARGLGARAVRCDVLAANAPLRRFYERYGYRLRGTRSHSGWTFACYERTLDP